MKKLTIHIILLIAFITGVQAKNKHSNSTEYPIYQGLVMAGYQGCFRATAEGVMYPDEKKVHIDMWPELAE